VVNLKEMPISDYALNLKESIMPDGNLTVISQLDATQTSTIIVRGGRFGNFKPLAELPPYQAYIFLLK
jgi:hypothetical protein